MPSTMYQRCRPVRVLSCAVFEGQLTCGLKVEIEYDYESHDPETGRGAWIVLHSAQVMDQDNCDILDVLRDDEIEHLKTLAIEDARETLE